MDFLNCRPHPYQQQSDRFIELFLVLYCVILYESQFFPNFVVPKLYRFVPFVPELFPEEAGICSQIVPKATTSIEFFWAIIFNLYHYFPSYPDISYYITLCQITSEKSSIPHEEKSNVLYR